METRTELKVYRVQKRCEDVECNGFMEAGNEILLSSPPKYPHYCNQCGRRSIYLKGYPAIEYFEADADPDWQGMEVK